MAKTEAEILAGISKKHFDSADAEFEAFQKELEGEPKKAADPVVEVDNKKTEAVDPYAAFRSSDFSAKKSPEADAGIESDPKINDILTDEKPVDLARKEKDIEGGENISSVEKAESAESGVAKERESEGNEGSEQKDPLLEKLEDARGEYAKIEFENKSKWESVKRFFGLKGNKESEDVRCERERYEKALDDYRKVKIAELQKKSEAGEDINKEMSDLLMMFRYQEVIDLADSRTQAKLESLKGTTWGKIRSVPTKIAQAYNKIPLGVKLGIGAAAFLSGSVAFMAGRRILGGIVTGVGLSKGYEALDQKIMQKIAQAGTNAELKGLESLDGDRFANLNALLDRHIAGENGAAERMKNMLDRRSRGKAFAIAVGGTMSALGLSKFAEHAFGGDVSQFSSGGPRLETPTTDSFIKPDASKIPSPFEQNIQDGPLASRVAGGMQNVAENTHGINSDSIAEIGAVKGAVEGIAANHFEVPVGSGQSIESVLIKTLEARGVENPGAVAHRMVLEYADNHDLAVDKLSHIKSANFDIEPGGKNGFQIKDLKFDALKSHLGHGGNLGVGGVDQVEPTATYTETHIPAGGQNINQEVLRQAFENEASATNPYHAQAHDAYDNLRETNKAWEAASTRHVSPPSGSFLHDDDFGPKQVTDLHGPDADRVAELATKREAYANMVQELGAKSHSFKEIGGSVIKGMSGNKIDTWRQIKDLSYNDAINQPGTKTGILKTLAKLKSVLGEDAIKPLNGGHEKMGSMVTRLAKVAIEKGGK